MANRYIRDDARTSKALASVTDFAERLFWRLLLVADDYGRFESSPEVALAACFPRRLDHISRLMIELALHELETAKVIRLYMSDEDEVYGEFLGQFRRYFGKRAKHSKYPDPPASARIRTQMQTDASCAQMHAHAPEQRVSSTEDRETRNDTLSDAQVRNTHLPNDLAAIAGRVMDKLPRSTADA